MNGIVFEPVSDKASMNEVARLAREIWTPYYTPIIGTGQVAYMLDRFQSAEAVQDQILNQGYMYYMIKRGSLDIGYLALVPKTGEGVLFISKIYVLSSERGKGIGGEALKFTDRLAATMGLHKVVLTVNRNNTIAITAYIRAGFATKGPIVTDIGGGYVMDDWLMEKAIW